MNAQPVKTDQLAKGNPVKPDRRTVTSKSELSRLCSSNLNMVGTSFLETETCHVLYASTPDSCGDRSSEYIKLCCSDDGCKQKVI